MMHLMLPFFAFMHLHYCISSRYARCIMRGHETRDNRVKPEGGVGRPISKMEGPWSACLEWKMFSKMVYGGPIPKIEGLSKC